MTEAYNNRTKNLFAKTGGSSFDKT